MKIYHLLNKGRESIPVYFPEQLPKLRRPSGNNRNSKQSTILQVPNLPLLRRIPKINLKKADLDWLYNIQYNIGSYITEIRENFTISEKRLKKISKNFNVSGKRLKKISKKF